MSSTDTTSTGAAGVAPMPAFVVRPCLREGAVATAPPAAPEQGTGLPATGTTVGGRPALRPWEPVLAGTAVLAHTARVFGGATGNGGYAQRIDSTTPGDQPPGAPLS